MLKEAFVEFLGTSFITLTSAMVRIHYPTSSFMISLTTFFSVMAFSAISFPLTKSYLNPMFTFCQALINQIDVIRASLYIFV